MTGAEVAMLNDSKIDPNTRCAEELCGNFPDA